MMDVSLGCDMLIQSIQFLSFDQRRQRRYIEHLCLSSGEQA